ncbi:hypothetical protein DIPPA_32010 [Diplonema papillatum]|nr:hypothetical protein DIPPA_32010 [Diplonema papillatum]
MQWRLLATLALAAAATQPPARAGDAAAAGVAVSALIRFEEDGSAALKDVVPVHDENARGLGLVDWALDLDEWAAGAPEAEGVPEGSLVLTCDVDGEPVLHQHQRAAWLAPGGAGVLGKGAVAIAVFPYGLCEELTLHRRGNAHARATFNVRLQQPPVNAGHWARHPPKLETLEHARYAPPPPRPRRAGAALAAAGDTIEHFNVQVVGPVDEVNNLVFLSGGYLESDRDTFIADVDNAVGLFKFPPATAMRTSVPFYRYFDTVNVFSVWQPSEERGASHPPDTVVKDNLKCEFGRTNANLLFCDRDLTLALAETSPAKPRSGGRLNTVVIVLVNDPQRGGGGVFSTKIKLGCFNNGYDVSDAKEKFNFANLLFHELGHAWGNLFDEYDMNIVEPNVVDLANCAHPSLAGNLPWQPWVEKAKSDPSLLISADPAAGCGYSNYLRPSTDCLMWKSSSERLCPVCREAVTKQLYATRFSLLWPICPLPDEIVQVRPLSKLALHANAKLIAKGGFTVTWLLNGNPLCAPATCKATMEIPSSQLAMGRNTVVLTVSDEIGWVLDTTPAMSQSRTFLIDQVVAHNNASGALRQRKCYCDGDADTSICRGGPDFFDAPSADVEEFYFAECAAGGDCTIDFTTTSYQPSDFEPEHLEKYDGAVLIIGIAAAVFLLGLWFTAFTKWRRNMNAQVRPIFKLGFKKVFIIIRTVMTVAAVVFMVTALVTFSIAMYLYTDVDGLGKYLLLPGAVSAFVLYLIAFLGFWAAIYRSTCLLGLNGGVLLVCLGITVTIAYFAKWFANNVGDPDSEASAFLKDLWEDGVKDSPELVCSIQKVLQCSGYEENCQRLTSTLHCPDRCDETNTKYSEACKSSIKAKIEFYGPRVFTFSVVVAVLLLIGIVFDFILCYAVVEMQKELKNLKNTRLRRNPSICARPADYDKRRKSLRRSWKRASFDGRKRSSVAEFSVLDGIPMMGNTVKGLDADSDSEYSDHLNETIIVLNELSTDERERLGREFDRTNNGTGTMNKKQFKNFMQNALGHNPTDAETADLFRAGNSGFNSNTIRFREVLNAAGDGTLKGDNTEHLLRQDREMTIRENIDALQRGLPPPNVPPEYTDNEELSSSDRQRIQDLRDVYVRGMQHQLAPTTQTVKVLSLLRPEGLGIQYATGVAGEVYVTGCTGAALDAAVPVGHALSLVDGRPIHSATDLAAAVGQAKRKGLREVTVVTKPRADSGMPLFAGSGDAPHWAKAADASKPTSASSPMSRRPILGFSPASASSNLLPEADSRSFADLDPILTGTPRYPALLPPREKVYTVDCTRPGGLGIHYTTVPPNTIEVTDAHGAGWDAGLRAGQVIVTVGSRAINSAGDLVQALGDAKRSGEKTVRVVVAEKGAREQAPLGESASTASLQPAQRQASFENPAVAGLGAASNDGSFAPLPLIAAGRGRIRITPASSRSPTSDSELLY